MPIRRASRYRNEIIPDSVSDAEAVLHLLLETQSSLRALQLTADGSGLVVWHAIHHLAGAITEARRDLRNAKKRK